MAKVVTKVTAELVVVSVILSCRRDCDDDLTFRRQLDDVKELEYDLVVQTSLLMLDDDVTSLEHIGDVSCCGQWTVTYPA
jgi:hypothetical protein